MRICDNGECGTRVSLNNSRAPVGRGTPMDLCEPCEKALLGRDWITLGERAGHRERLREERDGALMKAARDEAEWRAMGLRLNEAEKRRDQLALIEQAAYDLKLAWDLSKSSVAVEEAVERLIGVLDPRDQVSGGAQNNPNESTRDDARDASSAPRDDDSAAERVLVSSLTMRAYDSSSGPYWAILTDQSVLVPIPGYEIIFHNIYLPRMTVTKQM